MQTSLLLLRPESPECNRGRRGRAGRGYRLSSGETLEEASRSGLLVIVFLRHFGCTFTRQILRGLETLRAEAEKRGARLVIAHMLNEGGEVKYTAAQGGVARVADPTRELYHAFGLRRGGCLELLGPKVWIGVWRRFSAAAARVRWLATAYRCPERSCSGTTGSSPASPRASIRHAGYCGLIPWHPNGR